MSRAPLFYCVFSLVIFFTVLPAEAQHIYANSSVLSSGNWYKISTDQPGIYRMDLSFLNKLGISGSSIPSSTIRLFGNGGGMLPEDPGKPVTDDLQEIAIYVADAGDGVINGNDYILFYSQGPHLWTLDTSARTFQHHQNLYSDVSYYYITTGGEGKRMSSVPVNQVPNITVTSYDERIFYERDTFNFLSSGKQWFGEEFASIPGRVLMHNFPFPVTARIESEAVSVKTRFISRSFGAPGVFKLKINNQSVGETEIAGVATGPYDLFARAESVDFNAIIAGTNLELQFSYNPGSANAQGWLDWFELTFRRELSVKANEQLLFRDRRSVGAGNTGRFEIGNAGPSLLVWDVSRHHEPRMINGTLINNRFSFTNDCSVVREYVCATPSLFKIPAPVGRIDNQNLHQPVIADYIIITHVSLWQQAQRLADFHRQTHGLRTLVATTAQVFNEFSSGIPDPSAIRNFVKMQYDRAGTDTNRRARYLLLFGDASFDFKSRIRGNTNLVPSYQTDQSLDPLSTYISDDFFGFLDDDENISGSGQSLLDIGIGRIPAKTPEEAMAYTDKILHYHSSQTLGAWRNELSFIADDEDQNLHLQDAEAIVNTVGSTNPLFNTNKLYLDLFDQETSPGGSRYPGADLIISNKLYSGNLIWNYTGHGGYRRLAEEVVLDQEIINRLNNQDRLPLFITATCDFAPYDNPLVSSIGENLLLRPKTGAIALMTTTRTVFAFSNRVMNTNYLQVALKPKPDGSYLSLGEAVKEAKNLTYRFFGDVINNRKFTLLGDPATTIHFPRYRVITTMVNGRAVSNTPDTLKALGRYRIEGIITDINGNRLTDFTGNVTASVFDKEETLRTKGNDPESIPVNVSVQNNVIFKGKASVSNGTFSLEFIVPRDISYRYGPGRISYYAENGLLDANGTDQEIITGGTGGVSLDTEGPELKAFLNDESFVSGGVSNSDPVLIVKATDSSGINITGSGIGHDFIATLDNDQSKQFVLNDYYETEKDDFRKGSLRFRLPVLEEGTHTLNIKAWDAANNSGETNLDFRIIKAQDLALEHVLNYPNPFTTRTTFWFNHNRGPGEELRISIQIFTVTGKLVKTLRSTIISEGNRSSDVEWDGRDEYGNRIGRGVYIYNLKVQTTDGKSVHKLEKLYIL